MTGRLATVPVVLGLAAACGDIDIAPSAPVPAKIAYECVDRGDPACGEADVPARIGVGGRFELRAECATGSACAAMDLAPAAPELARRDGDSFVAVAPGVVAMLGRSRTDERILDFVHLRIVDVAGLRVTLPDGTALPATLAVGEAREVRATAEDAEGATLGGSRDVAWVSSNAAVLAVVPGSTSASVTLAARRLGRATVVVSSADVSTTVVVDVVTATDAGAPEPPGDAAGGGGG